MVSFPGRSFLFGATKQCVSGFEFYLIGNSLCNTALDGACLAAAAVPTWSIMLHRRSSGSCQYSITCFILKYHTRRIFSAGNFSFFKNWVLVTKLWLLQEAFHSWGDSRDLVASYHLLAQRAPCKGKYLNIYNISFTSQVKPMQSLNLLIHCKVWLNG